MRIDYRWAQGQYDRLPALVAELLRRPVDVLVATGGTLSALAAKAATTSIPIVFVIGSDPIKFGLVASLNRPGGNATGVSFLVNVLTAKQFELLHEMVPRAKLIGFLVNPTNPNTESDTRNVRAAADSLGLLLHVLNASSEHDIDAAFAALAQQRADALLAEGRLDRLPPLAADLVRRQVAVIAATGGNNSALVAMQATSTIPIVFTSSDNPVERGLVASINRPGGNVTGVSWFGAELGPKRLGLLHELVPNATIVALLQSRISATACGVEMGLRSWAGLKAKT